VRAPALVSTAAQYGTTAARVGLRAGRSARISGRRTCQRPVFVVGCPRSGTTFVGSSLGSQPGFVDLGEVKPLKAAIPELAPLAEAEAAVRLRRVLERVRRLGLVGHLRAVEQTPETCFVLGAALLAYPEARAVHVLRDGRDVVCSLLERGWLSAGRAGEDDVGYAYGAHARFWVDAERSQEFGRAGDARRAAWAWREHVSSARAVSERTYELRYEALVADPAAAAAGVAKHLGVDPEPLARAFAAAHSTSAGRWRRDLTPEQLADVEREAGPLLRELGYIS
jgi:Sulfotransferase family